ncbi:MAG: LysM peptidoglycan-binding domain-containing protein [Bacilli bacterium]|nr:LysM peptidoglycan-binding domain-containing protein [Bacilli bacterium]
MKEIISVKKDIIFKTKISEITSLNLEHDYKIKDDLVEGKLVLSGSYKMTEASLLEEEFFYTIPFSIAISENIKKDTINIDINDFKYETQKDVMKIKVDLDLECEENTIENEEEIESIEEFENTYELENLNENNDILMENESYMENNLINDFDINEYIEKNTETIENNTETIENNTQIEQNNNELEKNIIINQIDNINDDKTISNITNIIDKNNETYHTYKVYIVREGDTLETICSKYNLLVDDLKEYNDLSNINIGDKIIIPQIINE